MKELTTSDRSRASRLHIWPLTDRQGKILFRLAPADILFLLGLVGAGVVSLWQHRRRPVLHLSSGIFIPENMPTGDTLERLEQRFQEAVDGSLFGSRLAYLYAVLFDPDLILSYIDDRWLARQVEADNLANSSALFLCAAAIEAAVKDRTFGDTPSNTLASYLRSEFKKRGWLWPSSPFVWKLHFLKHYFEVLF